MFAQSNCPNCGATLPASAFSSEVVTCQYCNATFRMSRTPTPEPDMGNLVLAADFSQDPIPGWAFPSRDKIQLLNDSVPELRANFPPQIGLYYALNSSGYFDNIDASVSIKFYDGNLDLIDAGLVLRYHKNVGSYCVLISPLGTYTLGYYQKGEVDDAMDWKSIMPWTRHSAIRKGLNQVNRLRVIANGDRLRIYLNGVLATSIRDDRFDEGEVLLAIESGEKSVIDVGFTDLQLREVKG